MGAGGRERARRGVRRGGEMGRRGGRDKVNGE